mmetsp:Transcript_18715/g.28688  ORF Transcript_18715/g.28688 Transcript_18715/m.28688 type:complete len:93 (+) Transcript_18715:238-516(+)
MVDTLISHKPGEYNDFNFGKWSEEEHHLFLEALKLFGKDWEAIQGHVRSRNIKNIRSHAQKFFGHLLKFLELEQTMEEMTEAEAMFYHGILT